eukprot:20003-Heterococcus_DN1.PRE.2
MCSMNFTCASADRPAPCTCWQPRASSLSRPLQCLPSAMRALSPYSPTRGQSLMSRDCSWLHSGSMTAMPVSETCTQARSDSVRSVQPPPATTLRSSERAVQCGAAQYYRSMLSKCCNAHSSIAQACHSMFLPAQHLPSTLHGKPSLLAPARTQRLCSKLYYSIVTSDELCNTNLRAASSTQGRPDRSRSCTAVQHRAIERSPMSVTAMQPAKHSSRSPVACRAIAHKPTSLISEQPRKLSPIREPVYGGRATVRHT